jgi:hypothetical protein
MRQQIHLEGVPEGVSKTPFHATLYYFPVSRYYSVPMKIQFLRNTISRIAALLLMAASMFSMHVLHADEPIGSHYDKYYSFLVLTGRAERPSLMWRSYSANDWVVPDRPHPWQRRMPSPYGVPYKGSEGLDVTLIDPAAQASYNLAFNHGMNDGAAWQGRGLNLRSSAGFGVSSEVFSIVLYPEVWFAQNLEYDLLPPAGSQPDREFGAVIGGIDYPQRFGGEPIFRFDWGNSGVRMEARWFTFGLSTEALWWGPGLQNGLMMSNNAGGFPHIDFGVPKTEMRIGTVGLGTVELRYLWGFLSESEFYTERTGDDLRLLNGMLLAYSPPFVPSLTLGAVWAGMSPGGHFSGRDFFMLFSSIYSTIRAKTEEFGQDDDDQKFALMARWDFPAVGFSVYGEWAREDYSPSGRFFLLSPGHSAFYTLGGQKAFNIGPTRGLLFSVEISELLQSRDYEIDLGAGGSYYTHGAVRQGYTHRGQIIGAGVGPGSDTQYVGLDFYDGWGSVGAYFRRISWNKMYLYRNPQRTGTEGWGLTRLNVELDIGVQGVIFAGPIDIGYELAFIDMLNRNYVRENDVLSFYGKVGITYRTR